MSYSNLFNLELQVITKGLLLLISFNFLFVIIKVKLFHFVANNLFLVPSFNKP